MATLEKLVKAFEALKVVQQPSPAVSGSVKAQNKTESEVEDIHSSSISYVVSRKRETALSKKEKITHCSTVADAIISQNVKSVADFPKFLGIAMETFFICCDDNDSDVRMVADECLNKTIKTLLESHLARVQVELYKEIKKDGSAKCLRPALSRFADLCHLIRPQKCRPYAVNLFPCLVKISQRKDEESVQETLGVAVGKIMPILGKFANDTEIKMLLKAFLPNLKSSSPLVRRTAASSLVIICQNSRKPLFFYNWLLTSLLELILPIQQDRPLYAILGVMLCVRHIIPHLDDKTQNLVLKGSIGVRQKEEEVEISQDKLLEIYELLLHYCRHTDHNIVTAALEALQQLLRMPPKALRHLLLSVGGIRTSRIFTFTSHVGFRSRSGSQSAVAAATFEDEAALDDDSELLDLRNRESSESFTNELSSANDTQFSVELESEKQYYENQMETGSFASVDVEGEDVSEYSNITISGCTDGRLSPFVAPGVHSRNSPKRKPPALKIDDQESMEGCDDLEVEWEQVSSVSPSPFVKLEFNMINIGCFTDEDLPLIFCARLLASSFLLTGVKGKVLPDQNVRVSIKALAMSCLGSVLSLYPSAFFLDIYKSSELMKQCESQQKICEVLHFTKHSDPHLRGHTALLIGLFLKSALSSWGVWWDKWSRSNCEVGQTSTLELAEIVDKLLQVTKDHSAIACRMAVLAFKHCLISLLQCSEGHLGLRVLDALLVLKDIPYWLVKVELLEVLGDIPFSVVQYLEESCKKIKKNSIQPKTLNYQERFLRGVVIPLLGEEDFRVRQMAASTIFRLVPHLFYPTDHPHHDPIVAVAKEKTTSFFLNSVLPNLVGSVHPLVHGLVHPFNYKETILPFSSTEASLSRIISILSKCLLTSCSRHMTYGCCQALCQLSEKYLVTVFTTAWGIVYGSSRSVAQKTHHKHSKLQGISSYVPDISTDESQLPCTSLLHHLLALLTGTPLGIDLTAHQHTLQLAGNIMAGICLQNLTSKSDGTQDVMPSDQMWNFLKPHYVIPLIEQLITHVMRMLNVFAHILENQLPASFHAKSTLPSLPHPPSLSPIKRKSKGKEEATPVPSNMPGVKSSSSRPIQEKNELEKEKPSGKSVGIGQFYSFPLYMKIYDVLKGVYFSYKISADFHGNEKFSGLLRVCVSVLSQILEIAGLQEMGKHAEEILGYLKASIAIEPCATIQCVRQLLKSLFGTNLAALWEGSQQPNTTSCKPGCAARLSTAVHPGLYHSCFTVPYTEFTQSLSSSSAKPLLLTGDGEQLGSWLSWMRKRSERKLTSLLKSGSRGEKASLSSHIRLFEPLVIRALKQYTLTSTVDLQCQVLDLLAQLVQLRVNYCLLDSDQIFINFIIKQFEFIEEGQIVNADVLIPRIFYFLVLLSYERYHSKSIITVPKIIQLCDGLMASGQPPDKYAIPALQPVVEDLFLLRGSNKIDSGKELDTQREVVVFMLLRLIQYPQVLDMFLIILYQSYKEGEDRWKKVSRQIVDCVLPVLAKQQIQISDQNSVDTLHRLFQAVAPSVFRPVDILLKTLFTQPQDLNCSSILNQWMCLVLVVMRVLIGQAKEEVVLSRLGDLGLVMGIPKLADFPMAQTSWLGPSPTLCVSVDSESGPLPEEILARFLFQVLGIVVEAVHRQIFIPAVPVDYQTFICQQMAHLFLYLMHMFQSGSFRRVATAAMELVKAESSTKTVSYATVSMYSVTEINEMFIELAPFYPVLVLQWCNILTLLNYDSHDFWAKILQHGSLHASPATLPASPRQLPTKCEITQTSCNLEMVQRGGLILLCDYVYENLNDAEQITWLIVHHVNDLVELSSELPVHDFISAVHRNPAASSLLVQAIHARCVNLSKPSFVNRTLRCLESIHPSQSGSLLALLIDKFLPTHHLTTARLCDSLACRRLELLLADTPEDARSQLPMEDIEKLLDIMNNAGIKKRHQRLVSLLEKLKSVITKESSIQSDHSLLTMTFQPVETTLNKDWYLGKVKEQCFSQQACVKECAQLLAKLKYEDALTIMVAKEFHLSILMESLSYGAELTLAADNCLSPNSTPDSPLGGITSPESALYRAAKSTLIQHTTHLVSLLPRPHQAFLPHAEVNTPREAKHRNKLVDLFTDTPFWDVLFQVIPAMTEYLHSLKVLPGQHEVPVDSLVDVGRLAILCAEVIQWMVERGQKVSGEQLKVALEALDEALKNQSLCAVIGLQDNFTWVCSAVSAVYNLVVEIQHEEIIPTPCILPKNVDLSPVEQLRAQKACLQMSHLICWLEQCDKAIYTIPIFVKQLLKSVIVGLGRLPLVNGFSRTPPVLWELGWSPELGGEMKTQVPPPPGEYLQERDVLQQYIYRINILGWTSRQQFEETWMALLGVLSATPVGEIETPEEEQERIHTSCLAVKCITSLLLQTMLLPQPGNPHNSIYLCQPRDKPLAFLHTKCCQSKRTSISKNFRISLHDTRMCGKKLQSVCAPLRQKMQKLLKQRKCSGLFICNSERDFSQTAYVLGQVSVEYLCVATGLMDDADEHDISSSSSSSPSSFGGVAAYHQREQSLAAAGLDIHSCLHFLLDLYSQWLSTSSCTCSPLTLLSEVTRSVVFLSDIFMERSQFEWMLDTFLELHRVHPAEDEIMAQYLIVGISKAAAVLGVEQDLLERLKKLVDLSLRSTFLPTRIATLHGILYLLEYGSGDDSFLILPSAMDYVIKHLDNNNLPSSNNEEHVLVMWAVAFYILENFMEENTENNFRKKVFQLCINICGKPESDSLPGVYFMVLHGLDRILVADSLSVKEVEMLAKVVVGRIRQGSPVESIVSLGLLLSTMYVGEAREMWNPRLKSTIEEIVSKDSSDVAIQTDPEQLIVAMERVTVVFDRIRRGYPFEAEVICRVLPYCLMEFFPAQDVLNKVIGEFLSSQQPHPQLLAGMVFNVFDWLHQHSLEEVIHDWVMLSLSNFTQRSPVSMAIWSLTCFFVSATATPWLRSLFPHVQKRMGKLEDHDKEIFCIAGLDFKNQLTQTKQHEAFLSTVQAVAQPGTLYADFLKCL
ncbi:huntingtin isoform X3 [Tachypleus tridentatus]|uniref:huntingtin isoform X3 n=1 Tax=Tachypleus tridentatus TaxID=6853 RepID=UPI003FD2605C